MTAFSPEVREFVQDGVDDHGFLSWLGVQVDELDPGRIVLRVPFEESLANSGRDGPRTVHGGVAATLVDTAGGLAVRSALDDPLETGVATIDLDVSYLRPATADLVATGEVVRAGRSIGVGEVTVETRADGEPEEVAVGRGSYRILG